MATASMRRTALCLALALVGFTLGHGAAAQRTFSFAFDDAPGAPSVNDALKERLATAWTDRAVDYVPRTQHLRADGSPKYLNRLFLEASPYLRQHAHNPLNWFPWGDEAFDLARTLGRPVFLSIGYSTCHWCHVMEEESFDDEEIARYLNENYIAIKVDREIRPDLDAIYMTVVQLFQGRGGWPMSVWLTPDRTPYGGGTYYPARDGDRGQSTGFLTLLREMKNSFDEQPDQVADLSSRVTDRVREVLAPGDGGGSLPTDAPLEATAAFYREQFDPVYGGLQGRMKFPSSLSIRFLLRHHRRTGDDQSLEMATRTLEKMAAGGIHDHVGGGFHRYATDPQWLVPHFEKMLYDNALLTSAYLEAYQVTGREDFAHVARAILRYVERDMTSPDGAFYSATDADSLGPGGEREEGWFFTWTPDELDTVLGSDRGTAIAALYRATKSGNFEGRTILNTPRAVADVAAQLGLSSDALSRTAAEARELLYAARAKRPPPLRDEKILTAWNGLMISAFAQAALALNEPTYAVRAERAADYVLGHLRGDERLFRAALGDRVQQAAYLSDYAFLVASLLDLYEATSELRWLTEAQALDSVLREHYEDTSDGGYFRTSEDHESLLTREKPSTDNAEPSGNSIQILNLLRLHEFTTDDQYRRRAEKAFEAFSDVLTERPTAVSEMLLAVDFHLDTPKEIVVVVPQGRQDAEPFLEELRGVFLPNRILAVVAEGDELESHSALIPLLEGKVARNGEPTAYVCENRICELPTTDPAVFARQIRATRQLE